MKELQKLFNICIDKLVEKEELLTAISIRNAQLEAENKQLKQRIAMLESARQAESSERECNAYNL